MWVFLGVQLLKLLRGCLQGCPRGLGTAAAGMLVPLSQDLVGFPCVGLPAVLPWMQGCLCGCPCALTSSSPVHLKSCIDGSREPPGFGLVMIAILPQRTSGVNKCQCGG